MAVDTETTGLDLYKGDKVFGISIATSDFSGYWDIRRTPQIVPFLMKELPRARRKVFHNASFDVKGLSDIGIKLDLSQCYDTSVRACIIDENLYSYRLDDLGIKYLKRGKFTGIYEKLAALFGGKATADAQMKNLHLAPPELVFEYATPDAEVTLGLFNWQEREIDRQDLEQIIKFEQDLLPITIQMEMRGVAVDVDEAERRAKKLERLRTKVQKDLDRMAGRPINPNPSKSLTELVAPVYKDGAWYAKDGTPLKTTPGGKPQLDKKALMRLRMPEAKLALGVRKLNRVIDVFLRGHILGKAVDGRVYPSIHQAKGEDGGTQTGRLSYSDPALQQVSARDVDMAREVRAVFIPYHDGHAWVCRDYEQSDFRVMTHLAKPPSVLEAYNRDPATDFHQICSDLTGVPRNPTYAGQANAKQINLGLIFGMGDGKCAAEMGMPYYFEKDDSGREWMRAGPEAIAVFDKYHSNLPEIRKFLTYAKTVARRRGYVKSLSGRHLRFPNYHETYKAGGYLFQAGTADIIKKALLDVHNSDVLQKYDAEIIITVHDEMSGSCPKAAAKEFNKALAHLMEHVYELRVPLLTDGGVGKNWYEAK